MNPHSNSLTSTTLVFRSLARWGDRIAFSGRGTTYTYREAADVIARYQAIFAREGLKRGQRVAVLSSNRAEIWFAMVATQGLGLCTTALHPLGSLDDHFYILTDAEIEFLVLDSDAYGARGRELAEGAAGIQKVFTLGESDFGINLVAEAAGTGPVAPVNLSEAEDFGTVNYSGGTTGRPKGAIRQQGAIAAGCNGLLANLEIPENSVFLAVAPISHVGGQFVLPILMRGGRIHLHNGFDPGLVLRDIAAEQVSITLMVPTMIGRLLDHPDLDKADLSSLKSLLYSAAPMPLDRLREGIRRIGPVFVELYAQMECFPISILQREDHDLDHPERLASCGHPASNVDLVLMDDENKPVAPGEVGEICLRGPQMVLEYWRQPEQTKAAFAAGWLHTGDLGRLDDEGFLYIVGRKKDMIISGGYNVYPREVEDALSELPSVAAVSVIGAPDPVWGEIVVAVVVPEAGHSIDKAVLIDGVKARKGSVMAPKVIEIVDELPLTALGKPDKKAVVSWYLDRRENMTQDAETRG